MEQKKDAETTKDQIRNYDSDTAAMQENNATGENQNEQGRASFITGSTTGGGSNFGQGSSHLGAESYQQGSKVNTGANYNNESVGLADSLIGTKHEGSSSADTDIQQRGIGEDASYREGNATPESQDFQQGEEKRPDDETSQY